MALGKATLLVWTSNCIHRPPPAGPNPAHADPAGPGTSPVIPPPAELGAGRSPARAWSEKRSSEACGLREGRGPAGRSELGAQQVSCPVACCSWGRRGLLRFCFFLFLTELLKKTVMCAKHLKCLFEQKLI